jgi:hypothetical protein
MANIVERGEDGVIELGTVLLLIAIAVVVAVAIMGWRKFYAWLKDLWKRLFGSELNGKVGNLGDWFGKKSANMAIDSPAGTLLQKVSDFIQKATGQGEGDPNGQVAVSDGAQVHTGSNAQDVPDGSAVGDYGATDDDSNGEE